MGMDEVVRGILIAAASVVGSLVVTRTRFALLEQREKERERERDTYRKNERERLDKLFADVRLTAARHHRAERQSAAECQRRQAVTLEVVAEIAYALNIRHRALGVDALVRTIHESLNDTGGQK
jgi:ABC-type lipopolysaccharide export system ATPase subunit